MATTRTQKNRLDLNRIPRFHKADIGYGLLFIFLAAGLLVWLVFYCISPYWYSRDFIQHLNQNNLAVAEQQVPLSLLQPYQADMLITGQLIGQQWQGAGGSYLKTVWPRVAEQQNLHQLMLMHFNSANPDSIQQAYSDFPSRFRLTLGTTPHNTLWFEWQREPWNHWTLSRICIYNPQPVADVNNCLSSSR
jgi:hypothetical protein